MTVDSTAASSTELAPSERGSNTIAEIVVAKVAGIATREIRGVYDLGGAASRVAGALRERIPGTKQSATQGVHVEVGETEAAVDITMIAEYGIALHALADQVRTSVIDAVEGMTGLKVTEVNIEIQDVYIESEDAPEFELESETPVPPRVK